MHDKNYPNESAEYRQARNLLLEAEAALSQQVEQVAALRRQLPLGGAVKEDYIFDELDDNQAVKQVKLSELFAPGKDSLFIYSYMFSPDMETPCPMCTAMLDGLSGNAVHINQRINLAVVARSPIQRIAEVARARGWKNLRILSSAPSTYHADYLSEDDKGSQWPMANVFIKREGAVHHYWGSELLFTKHRDGEPRHVDMLWPLWNVLDLTPEGRGQGWHPALTYGS